MEMREGRRGEEIDGEEEGRERALGLDAPVRDRERAVRRDRAKGPDCFWEKNEGGRCKKTGGGGAKGEEASVEARVWVEAA